MVGWFLDIYYCFYYKSNKFLELKNNIKKNTLLCNELNKHIEELKNAYIDFETIDYGESNYVDHSKWNYSRPKLKKNRNSTLVYNCSLNVCKNANNQPFKYLCKYFNIKPNEENLCKFEKILNDFSAAEQGKILLKKERERILEKISNKIPTFLILCDKLNLLTKLGFDYVNFNELYFPKYSFRYVSAGGNSSLYCNITLDIDNLNKFIVYLANIIKFKKSIAGQRALMTTSLREKIKKRDNYTCRFCGNSPRKEPNLLLEIDHIIPLSKNGLTVEDNLQTLCWKCNRRKGKKIL